MRTKRFQRTPAFWRYFGARLKPFTKPLFLGSVGFLTLSGVAIYQYWHHPDLLQNRIEEPLKAVLGSRNLQPISPVLEEDLAALADIDNIELLLQEMAQSQAANSFNSISSTKKGNNKNVANTKFSRFKKQQEDKFKNASAASSNYLKRNNNALEQLLKPPSINNFSSNLPKKQNTNNIVSNAKSNTTTNNVGRLYLSNSNSVLNNPVKSPYSRSNHLSKLGDFSGDLKIRQEVVNNTQGINSSSNFSDSFNQTQVTQLNNLPNQATNINNLPNRFSSPSNTSQNNTTINSQNQENNSIPLNRSNIYFAPRINYNQSVPSNYQLQPSGFAQQNPRTFNQLNPSNSNLLENNSRVNNTLPTNNPLSNIIQNQQQNNNKFSGQNATQPTQLNNQLINNGFSSPTLQPAGSLSTSPLQ